MRLRSTLARSWAPAELHRPPSSLLVSPCSPRPFPLFSRAPLFLHSEPTCLAQRADMRL